MILGRGGKNTQKNYAKKDLHDPDNHDGVITHLAYTVTNPIYLASYLQDTSGNGRLVIFICPGNIEKGGVIL